MNIQEFRNHPEYALCMEKINNWKKGCTYTVKWISIPEKKKTFLKWVLLDAIKKDLIKSVSTSYGLDNGLIETEEKFEKL